jgi:hypothetical protein
VAVALELGRSLWSVRTRQARLLRERARLRELVRVVVAKRDGGHWLWADPATEAAVSVELFALTYPGRPLSGARCPQRRVCGRHTDAWATVSPATSVSSNRRNRGAQGNSRVARGAAWGRCSEIS